jgi:hypothetical protein
MQDTWIDRARNWTTTRTRVRVLWCTRLPIWALIYWQSVMDRESQMWNLVEGTEAPGDPSSIISLKSWISTFHSSAQLAADPT